LEELFQIDTGQIGLVPNGHHNMEVEIEYAPQGAAVQRIRARFWIVGPPPQQVRAGIPFLGPRFFQTSRCIPDTRVAPADVAYSEEAGARTSVQPSDFP
jgi:hypothetical protein